MSNHQRLGADVVHVRLTREELGCLIQALLAERDALRGKYDLFTERPAQPTPDATRLVARLIELRRALG